MSSHKDMERRSQSGLGAITAVVQKEKKKSKRKLQS